MSNYSASNEAAFEAACPMGQDKCGYYDAETSLCVPTDETCREDPDLHKAAQCRAEIECLRRQLAGPLVKDCPAAVKLAEGLIEYWEQQAAWYEARASLDGDHE